MQGFFASSTIQKSAPNSLLPKCGACGLFKKCESPKMEFYGDGRKGILIVGDAPGETEDEEGRPFVGKAGNYLRDALDEIGIDLDKDCWSTNSIICHPKGTPTPEQVGYCRPNLRNTVELLSPKIIIPLGRAALSSVVAPYWQDVGQMARWTGWQIPLEDHWVCPTYHPNFLFMMKNDLLGKLFSQDLEAAIGLLHSPSQVLGLKGVVQRLYDVAQVEEALDILQQDSDWVAFDYETNCLKPEYSGAKIFSASVSNGKRTIAYPWAGAAIKATGEFLRSEKTRKIASNLKFEERWTRKTFGHGIRRWGWDTMIAAHVLDSREGITSLKFQSFVKLGIAKYNTNIEPYLTSDKNGRFNRIHEIAVSDLLLYNGLDSLLEYKLAMNQRKEMGYEG